MSYAGRRLLEIERFEPVPGACTVLSGNNGAGKTTLLKIAAGLLKPDTATVVLGGMRKSWQAAKRSLREHAVYLHQHVYMFDRRVTDNVTYGLRMSGIPAHERRTRTDEALQWAGLTDLASRNARFLSGGERQRLAMARARVLSPSVLLLDEPTANMDQEARQQTYFLIRRLVSDGIGVVVATHEHQVIGQLGDRHLELAGGKLREVGEGAGPAADYPAASTPARGGEAH